MGEVEFSKIVTAGLTDVGLVRSNNQDAIGEFTHTDSALRLLVVADGMGGHRGGEVASQMAVDTVGDSFRESRAAPPENLRVALERANRAINTASEKDGSLAGMGTTCVALLFGRNGKAWVAHVGDSRAYRLSAGRLSQLTNDHSVVGELMRMGKITSEQARNHPQRNEILRAIGTQESVSVDLSPVPVEPGDRFLLCSDGLSTMLSDTKIADVLGREAPEHAARILVDLANEHGGADNISVQIAAVPGTPRPASNAERNGRESAGIRGLLVWGAALLAVAWLFWLLMGR